MAVAVEQSIQGTTVSGTSIVLPSWSVVAGELILVAVAKREETIDPTVAGNGCTFVQIVDLDNAQGQNGINLFRAQVPANATGSITITLTGNADPVGAAAIRISGQEPGNNGADAVDALTTNAGPPVTDNNDMKLNITTIADNCLVLAWGTHRLGVFTPPAGQTTLQSVNVGSSGDTTNSSLWRLNGLKTPAGLVTMGADNDLDSDRDWCMCDISIKPVAAVAPIVDAGGPYSGDWNTPIALNATVTPGTDPTPTLAWTIDSGGTGTFLPSAAVEDPTFTPDNVGPYTLRLTVTPSDTGPVFDTASLTSNAVAPTVDAGGPYSGELGTPISLDATVTPGSDPAPTLLWTIDSGGTGTFLPSAVVEDPTFTPDDIGPYVLRLTVTPSDIGAVFDTANLESTDNPVSMGYFVGGRLVSATGDLVIIEIPVGTDPPADDLVYLAGLAHSQAGPLYVAIDDGLVARIMINGLPCQHNGVVLVNSVDPPDVNLAALGLVQDPASLAINPDPRDPLDPYVKGVSLDPQGAVRTGPYQPPPPEPPLLLNVQHWFDFTDGDTLFSDQAGTVPSTDGGDIRHAVNKGYDGTPVTTPDANPLVLTKEDNVLDGQSIARGSVAGAGLTATPAAGSGSGGATLAVVVRNRNAGASNDNVIDWFKIPGRISLNSDVVPQTWFQTLTDGGGNTNKPVVTDEWLWFYSTHDGSSQDFYTQASGLPQEDLSPATYTPVPTNSPMTVGGNNNDIAEIIIYDKYLTSAELADLEAYFVDKYGPDPFLNPPAKGSLAHWFDFSDNSTVWQDTPGTIPAANGLPVAQIDNKGTDGTALTSVSPTQRGTYSVGTFNGYNVFDGTGFPGQTFRRLTAAVAASRPAPPTLGVTMAAICRLRQTAPAGQNEIFAWGGSYRLNLNNPLVPGTDDMSYIFAPNVSALVAAPVIDDWYLIYAANETGGSTNDAIYGSPGPEILTPVGDPVSPILAGTTLEIDMISSNMEIAEVFWWDDALTALERQQLVIYADEKYGILPHS